MYLGIDVGASKTLLAVFNQDGEIVDSQRFPTPPGYKDFIGALGRVELAQKVRIAACCCALPGRLDRDKGIGIWFANIPWKNVPVRHDLEKLWPQAQVFIEHDAQLGALSEAKLLGNKFHKVLYLTLSTGVGGRIIIDGQIDPDFYGIESGQMVLEHDGELKRWEQFASGKALKKRYGKQAKDIDDPAIWREYAAGVALGLNEMIDTLLPDIIVIGGGVGAHYEKFSVYLKQALEKLSTPSVPLPPIIKAKRPEEAVIYGCYDFIKQKLDGKS
jgi:predicted NBD/HSP70 family sugar kinase